jgi:hypothetical protein
MRPLYGLKARTWLGMATAHGTNGSPLHEYDEYEEETMTLLRLCYIFVKTLCKIWLK